MNTEYNLLLCIIQIISIYNALMLGWNIKKIGRNKYKLIIKNENIAKMKLTDIVNNIVSF
jgi:hypothetical protein